MEAATRSGVLPRSRRCAAQRWYVSRAACSRRGRTRQRATNETNEAVVTGETQPPSSVFRVELPTQNARREIILEAYRELHYVSAVATGSEAEKAGIVPGMVLRAVSDPIQRNEMWNVREKGADGRVSSASLRNVRDAINSTRAYDITLEFERDIEVTADMVSVEAASEEEEEEEEDVEMMAPSSSSGDPITDRPDLYTDNWDGDVYIGGGVNELTVLVGLGIGVPLIGLAIAFGTRGVLWDVSPY